MELVIAKGTHKTWNLVWEQRCGSSMPKRRTEVNAVSFCHPSCWGSWREREYGEWGMNEWIKRDRTHEPTLAGSVFFSYLHPWEGKSKHVISPLQLWTAALVQETMWKRLIQAIVSFNLSVPIPLPFFLPLCVFLPPLVFLPQLHPCKCSFGIRSRISSVPWGKRQWSVVHTALASLYANIRKHKPAYRSSK